ncbi:MAG: alpha/beta fold hydrolase [Rhizobiaceae bacterium]
MRDLEAVTDAIELKCIFLLGISQRCTVSIEYAVRHPDRVSALILICGFATGWGVGCSAEEQTRREAVLILTQHGWGTSSPAYRHMFSQTLMPDAKPEELDWFDAKRHHRRMRCDFRRRTEISTCGNVCRRVRFPRLSFVLAMISAIGSNKVQTRHRYFGRPLRISR